MSHSLSDVPTASILRLMAASMGERHPTLFGGEGAAGGVLPEYAHFHSLMCIFASNKSERSLAIQNNVLNALRSFLNRYLFIHR
jgi:hypothetical protein